MTILFRYLAREIFAATVLLFMALLALFAVFDVIRELGDVGKAGYGIGLVLSYVLLSLPGHVVVIFPVAALLGTLFALSRLSTQSELTVMRASGLSILRLAIYVSLIGIAFTFVTFLFGEFVSPAAEEFAKRLRLSATSSVVAQEFRSGFWVKDERSFVNIQNVTLDSQLLNIRLYEFDNAFRLVSIRIAKGATYAENHRWMMNEVEKTTFQDSRVRIEKLPVAYWNSALTPELLSVLRVKPEEMSLVNLFAYIDHLRENKQNSTRYELALWGKIFRPLAVIIMMLLAIPFAIQSSRMGGAGGRLLLGTMIGLGFHFLSQLTAHLTVLNDWPPSLAAAMPILLFMLIALIMLAWKEHMPRLHGNRLGLGRG